MTTATKQTQPGTIVTFDMGILSPAYVGKGMTARAQVIRHYGNGKMQVELVRDCGPWKAGKNLNLKHPCEATLVEMK